MKDKEIEARIEALVEEERRLREQLAPVRSPPPRSTRGWPRPRPRSTGCGTCSGSAERCREFDADPDQAKPRPEDEVEGYLQ